MNLYTVRIICLDSYMCKPTQGLDVMYSEFRGSAINQVPILRLFGATGAGKKICLHIHGVFPYFYIPYDGVEEVNSLMYRIARDIDKAINISLNQASSNSQHVYKIVLVSGIPMYGYHGRKHQFLKIYMYNHLLIKRASQLVMNDTTLGRIYQPHETHLPFTLQFMMDYNLHGMSNLMISEMKFRVDPSNVNSNISPESLLPAVIKKVSVCELEGDVFAEHILNRLEVASGNIGINPGIAALWADEMQRRRNKGEMSQIEHLLELKNTNVEPTNSHLIFKQALLERLAITSPDNNVMVEKLDLSVYPAETPENLNIQNASLIDSQTPSSLDLSLNDTILTSMDTNDIVPSEELSNLSETLDEEAQNLLKILQNLEANAKEDVEEDSILSQVVKEIEDDKDLDLSMPLEAIMTPKKFVRNNDDSDGNDDMWNTTLIPQLDGECDDENEDYSHELVNESLYKNRITRSFHKTLYNDKSLKNQTIKEQKFIKKALYIRLVRTYPFVQKGKDMPILDDDFGFPDNTTVTIFKTDNNLWRAEDPSKVVCTVVNSNFAENIVEGSKYEKVKKKPLLKIRKPRKCNYLKTAAQLASWEFQFKRIKRKNQILRIMKKLHNKEHKICVLLSKNCKPVFKVIPGNRNKKYVRIRDIKINIISEIMLQTRNHIDPDLHIILQYPTKHSFLYIYNKSVYPEVTKIPKKFTKILKEDILKKFINKSIANAKNNNQNNYEHKKEKNVNLKQLSLLNNCNCNVSNSIEFLKNNAPFLNVLQENCNNFDNICVVNDTSTNHQNFQIKDKESQNNIQLEQIYFPPDIIDSLNENNCYIFSSKYLMNVADNNLMYTIKHQSVNQIRETLNHIQNELQKHVIYLREPICKKNNTTIENKPNDDNNVKEENETNNKSSELTENCSSCTFKNVLSNKKPKKNYFKGTADGLSEKTKKLSIVRNLRRSSRINHGKSENSLYVNSITEDTNETDKKEDTVICSNNIKRSSKGCSSKFASQTVTENASKKYLFLDGTIDSSSSSGDESNTLKRKRTLKKKSEVNVSRYSSLPVTICSSPGPSSQRDSSDKHLVSQSTIKTLEEKKTSVRKSVIKKSVCDINVKRKLRFGSTPSLQTTVIEEKLVCSYSPLKRQKRVVSNIYTPECITKDTNILSIKKCIDENTNIKNISSYNENCSNSFKQESCNGSTSSISKDYNSNASYGISGNEVAGSFFNSPHIAEKLNVTLNAAQKYDKESKYYAKEGTSKVLTPLSSIGSQKSSEEIQHSSGSSSFGLLTPYQYVAEGATHLSTIFEADIKNQGSEENSNTPLVYENDKDVTSRSFPRSLSSVINVSNCDMLPSKMLIPIKKAPTREEVTKSLDKYKIPLVKQSVPFYSNIQDVTGSVEVGYNVLKITSNTSAHLAEFESQTDSMNNFRKVKLKSFSSSLEWKRSNANNLVLSFCKDKDCIIVPIKKPPSVMAVKNWVKGKSNKIITEEKKTERLKIFIPLSPDNNSDDDNNDMNISLTLSPCTPINSQCNISQTVESSQTPKSRTPSLRRNLLVSQEKSSSINSCQITGVNRNNTYGFDNSTENLQAARTIVEHQHLTLLVMELHIRTRGEFKPNPQYDPICAIFYSVLNDVPADHPKAPKCKGVVAISSLPLRQDNVYNVPILDGAGIDCNVTYVDSEENLLNEFLKLIEYWDPDIFAGYEIQMLSWGYLIDRASVLGMNFKSLLSRTKDFKKYKDREEQNELQIIGRIILDVWRLMRHEIALQSYTFESITYHILHKRVPQYSFRDLSFWWDHRSTLYRHRTVHYYLFRVETILELFNKLDIIGRTSELARLFGIQFFEVLSRGSQFRVESMMMRLAKPLNFIPVSPSVQQKAKMKAPEYIPLVLEPESKLYNDPVIVLDFQSLYPSIIIAYNYCFTTCLGRVESLGKNTPFEFGAFQLKVSRKLLQKFMKKNLLNFSPCGMGFVKKEVRDGILPKMLREILDTRLMVKNSMKENKDDPLLQKVLHNRQLGLKLIANVTYGYTAANFSGRMPSVEVGDSVVSKGRETLRRAIEMVDNTPEWGARVVYGDTDSLFVMVPGKSRQHAFEVGKKIADAVTRANPDPIKLKLEKVYQPCILQTKKRYVGYMYESPEQKEPIYDAKGIETVRRDGCPAVSKMLEKCLRLLFETMDISLIKNYVLRQFNKILAGRVSIQDLTFAKEYRGASGYRPGACVPSLTLASKLKAVDKRNEPRSGERVPYIIVNGPPGLPLICLVRSPRDLLSDASLRPNALYYITKVIIPPINRCFNLIGADLNTWFSQMPRKQIQTLPNSVSPEKKSTISQYFSTTSCVSCGEQTQTGICDTCLGKSQTTSITLMEKLRNWERRNYSCNLICQSCTSTQTEIKCVSLDCPILYLRIQTNQDMQRTSYIRELMASNECFF